MVKVAAICIAILIALTIFARSNDYSEWNEFCIKNVNQPPHIENVCCDAYATAAVGTRSIIAHIPIVALLVDKERAYQVAERAAIAALERCL